MTLAYRQSSTPPQDHAHVGCTAHEVRLARAFEMEDLSPQLGDRCRYPAQKLRMKKYSLGALLLASFIAVVVGSAGTFLYTNITASGGDTMNMDFGIRMTREDGVSLFGVDEIQALLEQGAVITSLKSNGASFMKTGENDETVSMYFSGGSFPVDVKDTSNIDAENAR